MIVLELLAVSLVLSGFACVMIRVTGLSLLWSQRPVARLWPIMVFSFIGVCVLLFYPNILIGYVIGLFSPFGLMLPIIIACYLYQCMSNHQSVMGFKWQDVLFLSLWQLLLMLSSWSILPWQIYRLGDTPWVALIALGLLGYTYLRNLHLMATVIVVSLVLWASGMGSANWLDWISHAMLLIIAWSWLGWHILAGCFRRLKIMLV